MKQKRLCEIQTPSTHLIIMNGYMISMEVISFVAELKKRCHKTKSIQIIQNIMLT